MLNSPFPKVEIQKCLSSLNLASVIGEEKVVPLITLFSSFLIRFNLNTPLYFEVTQNSFSLYFVIETTCISSAMFCNSVIFKSFILALNKPLLVAIRRVFL